MSEKIHFIITGGTIDKSYNPVTEKPESHNISVIPDYIQKIIQPHFPLSFETPCLKDSLDITDDFRAHLVELIQKNEAKKIIITHGTSTLTNTAEFLEKHLDPQTDKTIVLVGAMIPLKEFAMSDAGFNLGYAIATVKNSDPGVYLCMNAQTYKPGHVRKNIEKGQFEDP